MRGAKGVGAVYGTSAFDDSVREFQTFSYKKKVNKQFLCEDSIVEEDNGKISNVVLSDELYLYAISYNSPYRFVGTGNSSEGFQFIKVI